MLSADRKDLFFRKGICMEEVKISSKGQIVIPKYLRDSLGLKQGDVVMIAKHDNKLILMKKPDDPLSALAEAGGKVAMKNIRRRIKEE